MPSLTLCPACTVNENIRVIRDVQNLFANRGGWSSSKEKGDGHKSARQEWRKAKISLMNTITKLETLIADAKLPSDVVADIKPALEAYDKKKVILGWVPGVEYVKGAEEMEPTEEDHENAKLMIDLLKLILDKEMTAEDKAYAANQPRNASPTDMEVQVEERSEVQQPSSTPASPRTPKALATSSSRVLQCPGTPKSILKRKCSVPTGSPTSTKRLRIMAIATVAPSHVIQLPSALETIFWKADPQPEEVVIEKGATTSQLHGEHTVAERCRAKGRWWRPGAGYEPGSWASGGFQEKVNTSMWRVLEQETDDKVKPDQPQVPEVPKEIEGLKLVVVVWIAMCWFKKVAPDVGKLKQQMALLEEGTKNAADKSEAEPETKS